MTSTGRGGLSNAERKFIVQGIELGARCDGRGRLDYRHVTIECGTLPAANGSARVQVVNGSTDIIGSVKVRNGRRPIAGACVLTPRVATGGNRGASTWRA